MNNQDKANFAQNLRVWARRLDADFSKLTAAKIDLMISQLQAIGYIVPGRLAAIVMAVRNSPEVKALGISKEESRSLATVVGGTIYVLSYQNSAAPVLGILSLCAKSDDDKIVMASHVTLMVDLVNKAIEARNGNKAANAASVTGAILGKLRR